MRHAAAVALREVVEVLSADEATRAALMESLSAPDPVARAAVLDVLRALRLGDAATFTDACSDDEPRVRLQGVRGLVSLDDVAGVSRAGGDPAREVRVAVAHGLGTIGHADAAVPLIGLAGDTEALVRAAALEASAGLSGVEELWRLAVAGITAPEWQVRVGAARGLAAAPAEVAVPPLVSAVEDPHADVRKAAVITLARWADRPDVAEALERATKDADADVRGYARRALSEARRERPVSRR